MSLNVVECLCRKRDGGELDRGAIFELIQGYVAGSVPDYQMAAFAMAVAVRGMTTEETAALTEAMLKSGETLSWSAGACLVDKHSTGGIGDKVSLVLAPMLAACGLRVPMISGRGLGPTGGTLDKLEAIPGFRTNLDLGELQTVVDEVGCCINGATAEIAPADRKLYALRDVTGTVPSIPLITASILSKKLAEGLDSLVMDVKWGSGAFMKSREHAIALAKSLVETGNAMGVATEAILTDMNQPLGRKIGNGVEVRESLDVLEGHGPEDLMEVTLALGTVLLCRCDPTLNEKSAREKLQQTIASGAAMERFERMVASQGGRLLEFQDSAIDSDIVTREAGVVQAIQTEALGWAVIELGGGRKTLSDGLDHHVGLEYFVRIGERVERDQPWIRILGTPSAERLQTAKKMLEGAITLGEQHIQPPVLVSAKFEEGTDGIIE